MEWSSEYDKDPTNDNGPKTKKLLPDRFQQNCIQICKSHVGKSIENNHRLVTQAYVS